MIGRPKYKENDVVYFKVNGKRKKGMIKFVHAYGIMFDKSDCFYDIYCIDTNTKFRHIKEKDILK